MSYDGQLHANLIPHAEFVAGSRGAPLLFALKARSGKPRFLAEPLFALAKEGSNLRGLAPILGPLGIFPHK